MCILLFTILSFCQLKNYEKVENKKNISIKPYVAGYTCDPSPVTPPVDTGGCTDAYTAVATDLAAVTSKNVKASKEEQHEDENSLKLEENLKKKTAALFITDLPAFLSACLKTKCETSCSSVIGGGIEEAGVTLAFKNKFLAGCNPTTATTTPVPTPTAKSIGTMEIKSSAYLIMLSLLLSFISAKW
jgi:hypothetical protein